MAATVAAKSAWPGGADRTTGSDEERLRAIVAAATILLAGNDKKKSTNKWHQDSTRDATPCQIPRSLHQVRKLLL
jgi:hypothetical protein